MDNNREPTLGDTVEQISLGKMGVRTGNALNELVLEQERQIAAQKQYSAGSSVSSGVAGGSGTGESPVPGIAGLASGIGLGYWLAVSTSLTWPWIAGLGLASFLFVAWLLQGPLNWVSKVVWGFVRLAFLLILIGAVLWGLNEAGIFQG